MTKKKRGCGLIIVLVLTATLIFGVRWAWKYYRLPSLPDRKEYKTLEERSDKALAYAKAHNMSEKYALFVDYGLPSGTPRMFMWDFEKQEVIATTYVMHGPGGGSTAERARFSNKPGSKCSALGRFMVTRDHGIRLKRSYRLKGMDLDNQSAYARGLMIHPAKWVNSMCWKEYIPLNATACSGCVTVASRGMDQIVYMVNKERKPLLLWNYCSKGDSD